MHGHMPNSRRIDIRLWQWWHKFLSDCVKNKRTNQVEKSLWTMEHDLFENNPSFQWPQAFNSIWLSLNVSTTIDMNFQFQSNNGYVFKTHPRQESLSSNRQQKNLMFLILIWICQKFMKKKNTKQHNTETPNFNYFKPSDAFSKQPFYYLAWWISSSSSLFLATCLIFHLEFSLKPY